MAAQLRLGLLLKSANSCIVPATFHQHRFPHTLSALILQVKNQARSKVSHPRWLVAAVLQFPEVRAAHFYVQPGTHREMGRAQRRLVTLRT